jgi:hypothetical protein
MVKSSETESITQTRIPSDSIKTSGSEKTKSEPSGTLSATIKSFNASEPELTLNSTVWEFPELDKLLSTETIPDPSKTTLALGELLLEPKKSQDK